MELWITYSFIAFIGYLFVNLGMKILSNENPYIISLVLYTSASIAMFIVLFQKGQFTLTSRLVSIAAIMGLFSVGATVFALKAMKIAPNAGYVVAIFSANFVILTILSVIFLGEALDFKGIIGTFAIFIGLALLSM